jgi:hypothetical protein
MFSPVTEPKRKKRVKMVCDVVLSEKMTPYPALDVCFNKYSCSIFVGGQGSGKTTLAMQLLSGPLRKVFHQIFVCMPVSSMNSIKDSPLSKLPGDQIFDSLSPDVAAELLQRVTENAARGEKSFILLDDVQRDLKDAETLRSLLHIVANMRHLHCSILVLAQNYVKVSPQLRNISSNLLIFSLSKAQLAKLHEEHLSMHVKDWDKITKATFGSGGRKFLLYNTASIRLFRGFGEEAQYLDADSDLLLK